MAILPVLLLGPSPWGPLPELAVITRPGAKSRRSETVAVAEALQAFRTIVALPDDVTLDGGDVLVLGRTIYAGASDRSSPAGHTALRHAVADFGYNVVSVPMRDCLHLKTAATRVAHDTVLFNPAWVDAASFDGADMIEVDPSEPFAANAVYVCDVIIHDSAHRRTRRLLEGLGITVLPVDASELAKAEGGVTCCSILVEDGPFTAGSGNKANGTD